MKCTCFVWKNSSLIGCSLQSWCWTVSFVSWQFFVFCHGLLQLSQLLISGYLKSTISTIERRYGLSSQTTGLLTSFNEVGNTLLIVLLSYFGSRVHRPRFIGCGAILVSLAGFLMSLPHFITGRYKYDQSIARILFSLTVIGPGVAFMLGSAMLRFYVDMDKVAGDPRWVGAWWLGYLVAASLVAVSAVPYFFFPREMPKEVGWVKVRQITWVKSKDFSPSSSRGSLERYFSPDFPVVLLRNLRHPVYLLVVLAQVNLSAMVAGLATFMGKFLERQFSLTASFANMIIGAVNIPGAMVGIVVGGAIMKRFQMSLRQCGALCILGMFLCVVLAFPLLFLGCPTQKVAGITYSGSSESEHHALECNLHCKCPERAYNPICGSDSIEYISPCYAGCEVVNIDALQNTNYTRCSCISENGFAGSAKPGACGTGCSHLLLPFVVLSCLAGILRRGRSFKAAPMTRPLFPCVLAWMPSPVLFGSAIDTTCILWEKKCDKNAACRYYDNDLFRHSQEDLNCEGGMLGAAEIGLLLGGLCYLCPAWRVLLHAISCACLHPNAAAERLHGSGPTH
uniref:Solute carrier organic anion transporter family member 2B1 n=1 Tax=Nothoprocta perdicaria TaxID=30464 RepID=A0A8C6ZXU6_NOTPE